jgi:hypothetical protein
MKPRPFDLPGVRFRDHPGGQRHLELARGHTRADLLYLSYHLGRDVEKIAAAARARGIEPPEGADSPLFAELSAAAARLRRERSAHVSVYRGYCLAVTVALPVALVLYVLTLSAASCAAVGFLLVTYAFNVFHMRHHFGGGLYAVGVSGQGARARAARALDRLTKPLYQLLDETFMVTPRHWIEQHQASHHVFTNHGTRDYDVARPYPFLRLHDNLGWRWFHGYQHLYAPLALAANGLAFPLDNWLRKGGRLGYLVAHYGILVAAPAFIHGLPAVLVAYLLTVGVTSLVTAYCFQVSHNARGVMRSQHVRGHFDGTYDEWVKFQVEESVSYGGYLTTLLVGGINLQTEHHIAPAIEPPLLHFFRHDLEPACAARGFGYRYLGGPVTSVVEYHQRLAEMARRPPATA